MIAPVASDSSRRLHEVSLIAQAACQLAVRVLFIGVNIWMATLFPPAWHWLAVPIAAIGSTAVAAFFYPPQLTGGVRAEYPRILGMFPGAEPVWPAHYPEDSAVGYRNAGNNCAFNAVAHLIDSDPMLAQWVRHPIREMDLETFVQFLRTYEVPWIDAFRAFVAGRPQPALLFLPFLAQFREGEARRIAELQDLFGKLLQVHPVLANFYRANDEAILARQSISQGRTATLRAALSAISFTISPNPHVQEDAPAILDVISSLLPPHMKSEVEIQRHVRTQGLPALQAGENLPRRETMGTIQLHFAEGDVRPTLEALIQRYHNQERGDACRYQGVDGNTHSYPLERTETRFLTAPDSLHFQLVRMGHERPPESWLNRWLPRLFPPLAWRGIKRDTPVQAPEQITIRLATGEERQYQLRSFVTHQGGFGDGHYVSGEIRGNHQFLENDSRVTLVENEAHRTRWQSCLEQAYLLCYVRV